MEFGRQVTHAAFADEAYRDSGRFRSVACISMPVDCFESNIKAILNSRTSSSELKWSKIKGADKARDAIQFFGNVVQLTLQRTMRSDVLTWDMHDSRHHNVFRRDDAQNQQNMFRMLFRDVFAKRWGSSINYWNLSVDAQGLKSPELLGRHLDIFGDLSVEVLEADSQDVPFIQVADVFAGIGAYSRQKADSFHNWKRQLNGQQSLLGFGQPLPYESVTKVDEHRFKLLGAFDAVLRRCDMPIVLDSKRGLWTKNPNEENCNINFWPYTPQGDYDKAPVKVR